MSTAPAAYVPRVLHPWECQHQHPPAPGCSAHGGGIWGLLERWRHAALRRGVLSPLPAVLCAIRVLSAKKSAAFWVEKVLSRTLAYRRVQEGSLHWRRKGSALREKQFIFCCCLFALAFVSSMLHGSVTFLVPFNPGFPNSSFLVRPLSCAALYAPCFAPRSLFSFHCIYASA